ncbi:chemotaxis protein CheW [Nitrosospira briensis]|uniref:chemotaxis protein CheW n=1 Tax=Nitrosospira briensis TaxID=35799 RepID=UPI0008E0E69A|nr:chemotaxis protein CheW [Nitrosospira briensis]SFN98637.1 CheW protein [Nitrosospira briensis]
MTDTPGASPQKDKKSTPINFHEIEQRLEFARAAVERRWIPSPEEVQGILQARALVLAQEQSSQEAAGEAVEVLEFILACERYAIEVQYVRQVAFLEGLTPLPCTPAFVLGIVNLHGAILPVINLKFFFELPEKGLTDLSKIIVLQSEKTLFGILADEVVSVRHILLADVHSSLPTLTGVRKIYLKGVTPERVALLDAGKLLASEDIIVQEQVAG